MINIESKSARLAKSSNIIKVYHELFALIVLVVISAVFFMRLFYPEQRLFMIPDFGESDVLHFNLPLKKILSLSLKQNEWPLWSNDLMAGFPVLAESQIGTFYLPNLVLFKYLEFVTAFNINLLLTFLLCGMGAYFFCRLLKLDIFASLATALIFSYSGYFSVHLNHFNLLQTASLMPWVFFAIAKYKKKKSVINLIFASFILSQQIFAGYFYLTFITLIGTVIILGIKSKKTWINLFSVIFISLFFSAIQILPTFELWKLSQRNVGLSFETVTSMSYPVRHLIAFIDPYFFGNPKFGSYPSFNSDWGIFWENTAYIGILPLIFSFTSLFLLKNRRKKLFIFLLLCSLLLLFGKHSPVYFLFSVFPFNMFRNTSRYIILVAFSLSILSGMTIGHIAEKLKSRLSLFAACILLFVIFILDEFSFSFNYPPVSPANNWISTPPAQQKLKSVNRLKTYGTEIAWNNIFLEKGWQNIEDYYFFKNFLYPNQNAIYGFSSVSINTGGLMPRRNALWKEQFEDAKFSMDNSSFILNILAKKSLTIWGADTIISPFTLIDSDWKIEEKLTSKNNTVYIYKNLKVREPEYFASNLVKVDSVEDFKEKLAKINEETLHEGEQNISFEKPEKYLIQKINHTDLKQSYLVNTDRKSLLVFNRSYFPGWNIYINSVKTPLIIVNLNQPAVIIPEGTHKINVIYENSSFRLGKIITVISHLTAFLAVFLSLFHSSHKSGTLHGRNRNRHNKASNSDTSNN